jgi:hypothetical protein
VASLLILDGVDDISGNEVPGVLEFVYFFATVEVPVVLYWL